MTESRIVLCAGAAILLFIAGIKKIYRQKPFFKKNWLIVDSFLYTCSFLLLGFYFYLAHIKIGMIMSALCGIAVGKFLYDKAKTGKEE
jgi:hypothetical protein